MVNMITLLGIMFTAGCQPNLVDVGTRLEPALSPAVTRLPDLPTQVLATPVRSDEIMTKVPERVPPSEAATPVIGEVPPELLTSILVDLAARTGTAADKFTVIRAQAIVWNDGSLGCPQPGEMYTQALVSGYWVVLEANGKTFDYRAADGGYFFQCSNEFSRTAPPSTPNT